VRLKKLCRKCNTEKLASAFGLDKNRYDGLQYQCRECRLVQRKKNSDKVKEGKRNSYYKNRDEILRKKRSEYQAKRDTKLAYQKSYWEANRELLLEKSKQFYKQRPNYYKEYREKSPEKVRAKESKRRCAKLQRTPIWLTVDDFWMISQAYELAALRGKMFGLEWHVDHVIPLQAKLASGLHVPQNLQVIPAAWNLSKQNNFEV
jgi:hypothetical protein